jgi:hypothetical protein
MIVTFPFSGVDSAFVFFDSTLYLGVVDSTLNDL